MEKHSQNAKPKKRSLHAIFGTFVFVFAICSTGCGENIWIEDGFEVPPNNVTYDITPVLATAVRTRKKQTNKVSFEIHAGYKRAYSDYVVWAVEDMNSNDWMYALHLTIHDSVGQVVTYFDYELVDFLNADKYFYTDKWLRRKFNFSFIKEFDIVDIGIDKGAFGFAISLSDNTLGYENCQFDYGVDSSELYFSKSDNNMVFSNKPFSS